MKNDPVDRLVELGFSEYEAKAYVALLRKSPVTGYELSKLSGVPRSMIYEVLGKLATRGAALKLRIEDGTKYAPVPAEDFIEQMEHEFTALTASLKEDLSSLASASDLEYVWNIEGHENIMARAREMIDRAQESVYLALLPTTFGPLRPNLEAAIQRRVRVVLYTTGDLDLPGGRVIVAQTSQKTLKQARGLGLILVIDGAEVLIGEWLTATHARASWTSSPLLVFIAEHHLRTDLYLPKILALLGHQAMDLIHEEDWDLFAHALESQTDHGR